MRLAELIPGGSPADAAAVKIESLAYDSRKVAPGALFFCVPGERSDGHDHAAAAVANGAAALVVERPLGLGVPEAVVASARAAMGPAAARFYGDPTATLQVVGVTGTNGKTTTAFLVRALLQASGHRCGLLGTVRSIVGGNERAAIRTTPEAIDLQADFRAMLDGGETACAMEVSSHALALGRADGVRFAAAIFTNLTQDHLDFHGTMEEYFQAKRRLFVPGAPGAARQISPAVARHASPAADRRPGRSSVARGASAGEAPEVSVVNLDDPYGRRLAAELPGAVTFAIERDADYRARDVEVARDGCRLRLSTPAVERALTLPLPGRFNLANALGALAAVHALTEAGRHRPAAGIPVSASELDTLVAALERGVRVPGRMEPVEEGQGYAVLVDYAHTPDSLQNALATARELTGGRVICVFGAGGDRDREKRPLMGAAAARLADVVIVTSDNPRSEEPRAIIEQIVEGTAGVRPLAERGTGAGDTRSARIPASASAEGECPPASVAAKVIVEPDRRAAIERGIEAAAAGDVVVIAGKGHEQGQEFEGGRVVVFDDVGVAREALRARHTRAAGAAA
ncbi:MAG TPA: UDP-N-acetylmuramoyl-L-alanyl-D-glutamate--2,6-diaminopimelate ligase [Solirubrobacteraceae bacterium]|jgi:UDP-N-acetylmuramoyl-L-alanyl-D-glutamate--2,6-diaminopimelate ligase|nr:UDP-N-acetylmuramoyl-L-alanyl-D-glutamate--2,6-diaminopimelate ligase [Solirubrobacteraceae bacterium]